MKRGVYILPNLFTIGAMFAGFYAIIAAAKGLYEVAAIAILIAIILDGMDGRVARLTGSVSEFGAQMDSMSDMVCFGVTPALVLYSWSLSSLGKVGWLIAFLYMVATALRLARFNSQDQGEDKRYFHGLATPIAAGLVATFIWVCTKYAISGHALAYFMGVVTIILAILKVSNLPYRSFKDINLRSRVSFFVILLMVLIIALIILDPQDVLLAIFLFYTLSGLVMYVWEKLFTRQKNKIEKK